MTQSPITVTYSLEQILTRLEGKIDNLQKDVNTKIDNLQKDVNDKIDKLEKDVNDIKIGQAKLEGQMKVLETDIKGVAKRLENQEFINRGVLIAFIGAIIVGAAKFFGWVGSP